MATMRAVQISKAKGPLELVQKEIPEPGFGQVRIKVKACGICHSDSFAKEGLYPGIKYPRVPGHEVAGEIDAVGQGVNEWKPGQRVGIGWNGGYCGYCEECRRGDFNKCSNLKVTGISYDGGYAEYMVAPANALALIPDELSFVEAGPLMCAGVTTYNSMRNSGTRPGEVVAILGIGGLGHLAVQYATKMGFYTIAIARGKDKEALAKQLGAKHYIDSEAEDPARALNKLGGARLILSTVTNSQAMGAVIGGLSTNGKLILVGASADPIEVPPMALIRKGLTIYGWPSGSSMDSQDTMLFSARNDVKAMVETYPLEKAAEAYDRMMSNKARFRIVLVP